MPLTAGHILNNRYHVEALLGQGAFGEVYRAQELQAPRRTVAIKFLRKDAPGIDAQLFAQCKDRFDLEAMLAGHFDSPHLIRVFTSEIVDGDLHLVMEYAAGGSLADLIQRFQQQRRVIPIQRVIEIGYQTALGLAALHEAQVIHRDLKPSNILLTSDGRVKIGDLGLAQTEHSVYGREITGSLSTEHPGTSQYMPPEQRPPHKEALKPPADVYALGCVLFELLTLKIYYYQEAGVHLRTLRPDIPVWLEKRVMQMLADQPEQRPWNGAKAAVAIIPPPAASSGSSRTGEREREKTPSVYPSQLSGTTPRTKPVKPVVRKHPFSQRIREQPLGWALAGISLLALLIWGIWYLYKPIPVPNNLTPSAQRSAGVTDHAIQTELVGAPSATIVSVADEKGVSMVLIPAGEFQMGSQNRDDEKPLHNVYLDAYYIDVYEVTNARYAACVSVKACQPPDDFGSKTRDNYYGDPRYADYPVIYVSWEMAESYCEWRGGALPSEAQWEQAARGGLYGMDYPWGNDQPVCEKEAVNGANFVGCTGNDTNQVGSFRPNGFGLYDMAGNVWEWIWDWYSKTYYDSQISFVNPFGPKSGVERVRRGGSWFDNPDWLRVAKRSKEVPVSYYLHGFRCSRSQ